MSPEMLGVICIALLIVLMMLNAPVGLTLMLVGFIGYIFLQDPAVALSQLGITTFNVANDYVLSVMPLFILMGMLLSYSGLGKDLFESANYWFGHYRGGLAVGTIGASAVFSAISGSPNATTATVARIALPEMKRFRYDAGLASASIAAGGTLGLLIPPSIGLILYGILTMEPIGELLIAGIIPGILCTFIFMLTIYIQTKIKPNLVPETEEKASLSVRMKSLKSVWPFMLIFVISIGGIYFGIFTPNEAAGIGAFSSFAYVLLSGRMNWKRLVESFDETVRLTAMIFIILIGASIFSKFLAVTKIPYSLSSAIASLEVSPYFVLFLILVLYFILGMFMEAISINVLTTPIIYPVIIDLGFDGIWFAIVFIIMINVGLMTPPLGMLPFIIHGIDPSVPLPKIFLYVIPMIIAMLVLVLIFIIFPDIVLFLPNIMH